MKESDKYLMVAALDFGTTYSGYAFSTRSDYESDPTKISANATWKSGSRSLMSLKTPTCLLLDKDKKFVAFGYDAETEYEEAVLEKKQDDFYFFYRFKMDLHNNKNITSSMVIEDISGKTLPAFVVFKMSIKALVDHMNACLETQGKIVGKDELRWVLTVPAIWTDQAKQFMRSSAEEAGIKPEMLVIALEPEAASIWCQYLSTEKLKGSESGFSMTTEGTKYMVVDLGGGTADITVHRKVANGKLEEEFRATGNDCGGTSVDNKFINLFEEIVGKPFMNSFKNDNPSFYLDLLRVFEDSKRGQNIQKMEKVTLNISVVTLDKKSKAFHNKTFEEVLLKSKYAKDITLIGDKLRLTGDTMRGLFQPTINSIVCLMKDILNNKMTEGVDRLLLVGGFSECPLIQEAVREHFSEKRIIIPEEAGLSVLKGAVLYGHCPTYVQSRVMRHSYGVKTHIKFDTRKFNESQRVRIDGEDYCDNIFSKIVEKDQVIKAGTSIKKEFFTPERRQKEMTISVYFSESQNTSFVTDKGCEILCTPTITFDDICEDRRWVDVEFIMGNTEIGMKAVDRISGKEISTTFNLFI